MGLLDQILGAIPGSDAGHGNVATAVLDMLGGAAPQASETAAQSPGLTSLVQQMSASGLGPIVQSWLGSGSNLPVSAQQLTASLHPEMLAGLAQKLGLNVESLAPMLAQILPSLVDKLTPPGATPPQGA